MEEVNQITQEQIEAMDDMAEAADGVQEAMDEAEFIRKQAAIAAGLVQARIGAKQWTGNRSL